MDGADDAESATLQPPVPWTAAQVADLCDGYGREIRLRESDAYEFGYADGFEAGVRAVEEDMAEHWGSIVRDVRKQIGRPSYEERRAAEREWVKPKLGDFMGRLAAAEYFGAGEAA